MAGIKIQLIVFIVNAPTLTDLITAGKLRPLAVTSRSRSSGLPQVPGVEETGLAGFESLAWNGLVAPARTARAVTLKICADAIKAINTPEMLQRVNSNRF